MLECLALEDSCINDTWNWIYANWSWGFFIAVLSLWFTAKALKKTDKANNLAEVSLELTRESTRIAEESLQAAKESIDTSIELYEKQKKDILLEKNSFDNKKIESIKIVIRHELGKMYLNYKGIMTSFEIIKKMMIFTFFLD
ncbi:hypothetical protein NFC79_13065 [Providencia stuartii]|nr:hypothetical protein NFC79_13065 [Providencia stuartii]